MCKKTWSNLREAHRRALKKKTTKSGTVFCISSLLRDSDDTESTSKKVNPSFQIGQEYLTKTDYLHRHC